LLRAPDPIQRLITHLNAPFNLLQMPQVHLNDLLTIDVYPHRDGRQNLVLVYHSSEQNCLT
jgi:hypothetical protein